MEITAEICKKRDEKNPDAHVLDVILDKTGMKGTGRWTIQEAAEQSVAAPTMAAALDARYISGLKEEREAASHILKAPTEVPSVSQEQIIEDLGQALFAAKICSYAQGMNVIKAASDKHSWGIELSECARIWQGGCIIRAGLLSTISAAYKKDPNLKNLMVDADFAEILNTRHMVRRPNPCPPPRPPPNPPTPPRPGAAS